MQACSFIDPAGSGARGEGGDGKNSAPEMFYR